MDIKLSIIIPYYNTKAYCDELLEKLDPQMTSAVQVILVDDGSDIPYEPEYGWVELYRQENGGVSSARNFGLKKVKGEYVTFMDSDDLVSDDYIESIMAQIDKGPDYIWLSWQAFGGWDGGKILKTLDDQFDPWNCCVWTRVYKSAIAQRFQFNEIKLIAEDAEYVRLVERECTTKAIVDHPIYFYRSNTENSLTKRFNKGELNTQRIVYYYKHIRKDMTWLLDEIKEADKYSEVIVMTDRNDIAELYDICMVLKPQ